MEHHELVETQKMDLVLMRDPKVILEEARKAAEALMEVVKHKKNPVFFNGQQYIEFEDWQTVGKFYGITARVTKSEFLDYGGAKGFESSADALGPDGRILSSAHAMCLNDEENWSTRPKYEWRDALDENQKKIWIAPAGGKKGYYKRDKIKLEDVPVPLFQLKSMAQTRAAAKALRNVLAWVVVLAGFAPTPAEEIGGTPDPNPADAPIPQKPKEKEEAPAAAHEAASQEEASQEQKAVVAGGVKMTSKKEGSCNHCHKEIVVGSEIVWNGKEKKAYHAGCVA